MSREKQIEEMARIIGHCESTLHPVIECHNKATGCYCIENPCHNQRIADKLYNAGYRKQSEGEWVEKDDGFGGVYYDCTACGCSWTTIDGTPMENNMNYCPECGAKMTGSAENAPDINVGNKSEWISVEERLPEPTYCVLVYGDEGEMEIDALGYDGEWMGYVDVTHWMPLPEAPKKGGGE